VVATARSAPLPGVIERLWRDGHCERIELTGLGDDEASELLETVLDAPADLEASAAFVRRAQGNPLLLRELVQAALQRSALVRRDSVWVLDGQPPLSGGVRDLVAARLAGVGEAERAGLEMVAAGEPLPADVALAMAGESRGPRRARHQPRDGRAPRPPCPSDAPLAAGHPAARGDTHPHRPPR